MIMIRNKNRIICHIAVWRKRNNPSIKTKNAKDKKLNKPNKIRKTLRMNKKIIVNKDKIHIQRILILKNFIEVNRSNRIINTVKIITLKFIKIKNRFQNKINST